MKVFYDNDASLEVLKGKKIGIIGYGIQGRAQALNLRDSGVDVIIGNRKDKYNNKAIDDGFEVKSIEEVASESSIILFLIPDQAQKEIYDTYINNNLNKKDMLIFAHGYSINFKEIIPPKNIDICLMAPRMPGDQIREYFLNGGGVPAFVDVYNDYSNQAWELLLGLAKGIGATRSGAMHVSFKEETETDLFIEQFLLPIIIKSIRLSFDRLSLKGFSPEVLLMELYASGEIGELILKAAKIGIYQVWEENASPTCQFGIFNSLDKVLDTNKTNNIIDTTINNIRNGSFVRDLSLEAENNYKNLNNYNLLNKESKLTKTQNNLNKIIKSHKE
jgi:ketol-acid reductoisomerase